MERSRCSLRTTWSNTGLKLRAPASGCGPTPHLLRLLLPVPPLATLPSPQPQKVSGFSFLFLLKTKQKSGIQGDLPNQAQGGFHLVSQLSPFLKCCYIKSLQQQKIDKAKTQVGMQNGTASRSEGSKITYSINKLKMNPLLLNQETHNTFISIAHSHFVIRNKSFRSGRGGAQGQRNCYIVFTIGGSEAVQGEEAPYPFSFPFGPLRP